MSPHDPTATRKQVKQLADQDFDLLVIGAGIHGATLACRAAEAGLKVALIDKNDYGAGASANSLKILHGGLRYLQQLNLPRMRESITARRDGMACLPHLVHPAPFMVPAVHSLKRSRMAYRAASVLNDAISADRNRGLPPSHRIPGTKVLSKDDIDRLFPDADLPGSGAMLWHDGFIENTERYTLSYVMTARQLGAVTANYVQAITLLQDGDTVQGAQVRDLESGAELDIRAAFTVNAAGPWIADLVPGGRHPETPSAWVRAWNVVTPRSWFGQYGIGLDHGNRNFFFAPWRGGTIIGTAYDVFTDHADACKLTPDDLALFADSVNVLYPKAELNAGDITFAHAGVLPAATDRSGGAIDRPSGDTRLLDFGMTGYLAVLGVKYTTGAFWAKRITARVLNQLHKIDAGQTVPLWDSVNPGWTTSKPGTPVPDSFIKRAVQEEDALHLDDILFRRTDAGTFSCPATESVAALAAAMKTLLGWTDEQERSEINRARQHYEKLGITASF